MTAPLEPVRKPRLSFDSITKSRKRLVAVMLALLLVGGITGFYLSQIGFPRIIRPVLAQGERGYTLEAKQTDIPVAPGPNDIMGDGDDVIWHAWTYNGTIPGPTLKAKVGEILKITLVNSFPSSGPLSLKHSVHTHLAPYPFTSDGSQANVINGTGAGGIVPPGGLYIYEFQLTSAGLFYYHCHSSDGGYEINEHMRQGLYGAIVVDEPDAPTVRDIPIFMSEIGPGQFIEGTGNPTYIMNGLGVPGGEMTLERIFADAGGGAAGLAAVANQFNKTLPAFTMKVGETARLHVVNIGNQLHSFHLHGINLVSQLYFPGRIWPANVVQLLPGAADSIIIRPQHAGLWLFHCHVVEHADRGMIGVLNVT